MINLITPRPTIPQIKESSDLHTFYLYNSRNRFLGYACSGTGGGVGGGKVQAKPVGNFLSTLTQGATSGVCVCVCVPSAVHCGCLKNYYWPGLKINAPRAPCRAQRSTMMTLLALAFGTSLRTRFLGYAYFSSCTTTTKPKRIWIKDSSDMRTFFLYNPFPDIRGIPSRGVL